MSNMLELNANAKMIIIIYRIGFDAYNAALECVTVFFRKRINYYSGQDIRCSKVCINFALAWIFVKYEIISLIMRVRVIGNPKRLAHINDHQHCKRYMQGGIGIIPNKPFVFSLSRRYTDKKNRNYDTYSFHGFIVPQEYEALTCGRSF